MKSIYSLIGQEFEKFRENFLKNYTGQKIALTFLESFQFNQEDSPFDFDDVESGFKGVKFA